MLQSPLLKLKSWTYLCQNSKNFKVLLQLNFVSLKHIKSSPILNQGLIRTIASIYLAPKFWWNQIIFKNFIQIPWEYIVWRKFVHSGLQMHWCSIHYSLMKSLNSFFHTCIYLHKYLLEWNHVPWLHVL